MILQELNTLHTICELEKKNTIVNNLSYVSQESSISRLPFNWK